MVPAFEKGNKMFTVYKISTNYTLHTNEFDSVDMQYEFYREPHTSSDAMYGTREEAEAVIETLSLRKQIGKYTRVFDYVVVPCEYGYANMHGWSDVAPFEIIRVISPKTIELRAMSAELDDEFKPEFVSGGFAGHCTNQGKQTYKYKSCPEGVVVRARLGKKGWKSSHGRHVLSTEPRKFYDYNF